MSSLKLLVITTLVCLASQAANAQQADESLARLLGPQWKDMCREAGMIFTGTVLSVAPEAPGSNSVPAIQLRLQVDRPIAGVRSRRIVTVREWAGAWARHRPMRAGDRLLLFLYPVSTAGLTSPMLGATGQLALDRSGTRLLSTDLTTRQLERAIRRAREE